MASTACPGSDDEAAGVVEVEGCVDRGKAKRRFLEYPVHSTLATSQRSHVGFLSSHLTRRVRHVMQPVRDRRFLSFMASVRGQQTALLSFYGVRLAQTAQTI